MEIERDNLCKVPSTVHSTTVMLFFLFATCFSLYFPFLCFYLKAARDLPPFSITQCPGKCWGWRDGRGLGAQGLVAPISPLASACSISQPQPGRQGWGMPGALEGPWPGLGS